LQNYHSEIRVGDTPTLPELIWAADTASLPHFMPPDYAPFSEPGRKHPAHDVLISLQQPAIVFLTVCAKDRQPWLAQPIVHDALRKIWLSTDAWLVGDYLLMPDHVHLFCAPRDLAVTLPRWVSFWKRELSCLHLPETGQWQRDFWDTRLRRSENYDQKWTYVRENPARAGLVQTPEAWPFQGRMNVLPW
jgi:putative transposase